MALVFPVIIMAVVAVALFVYHMALHRMNEKRKARGERPLTNDDAPVSVIDWTRRN